MDKDNKFHGVPVVKSIAYYESDMVQVAAEWVPDRGLMIPMVYHDGTCNFVFAMCIPRKVCKEMVKDLIHEIESE